MTTIKWMGPRDDKTATVGAYTLRAEMMGRGRWWWSASTPSRCVADVWDSSKAWPQTLAGAQRRAVAAMRKHAKEEK